MGKSFFDEEFIKNKIILQSSNKSSKVNLEKRESVCENCEIIFEICPGRSYSEEFVWHPDKEY